MLTRKLRSPVRARALFCYIMKHVIYSNILKPRKWKRICPGQLRTLIFVDFFFFCISTSYFPLLLFSLCAHAIGRKVQCMYGQGVFVIAMQME